MSRAKRALVVILVLGAIFFPGYVKMIELKAKNKALLKEIESLRRDNTKLTHQIERLENDPLYIEKKARDKIGIGKKDEIIYKIEEKASKPNG